MFFIRSRRNVDRFDRDAHRNRIDHCAGDRENWSN